MNKMTERDKLLAMLFPTLVIVTVYGIFFLRGKVTEVRQKWDAIARTTAPTDVEIAAKRVEVGRQNAELQRVQAELAKAQKKWQSETEFCSVGTQRHNRVEELTNLLNRHQLISMEDSEPESNNKDFHPSQSLDSMIKKIAQLSSDHKPQLRRIRFSGRFVNVHAALEDLTKGPVLAIPVGLSMKSTNHPELREWVLLVWL